MSGAMLRVCGSAFALLVLSALLSARSPAPVERWGAVKGQFVFRGKVLPNNPPVKVQVDRNYCLSKGAIHKNDIVVDPRSRGVRWVLVHLAPVKGFTKVANIPPIHPSLVKAPAKVEVTIPCCNFEPRMVAIREETALVFKNPNPICYNVKCDAVGGFNVLLLPKKEYTARNHKARHIPYPISDSVHPWMRAWVAVFRHPYFGVTDADGKFEIKKAPAGKWRLIAWQERIGWVLWSSRTERGQVIEIKPGRTTDLGSLPLALQD